MKTLYLIRHGQTHWNAEARMQGWLDSSLTEAGRGHAERNAELLAREGVEFLVVSPLGRARETAEIINARLDLPVRYEERLKERHCGAWEGLTLAEIERRWPQEMAARQREPFFHRPPGGENIPDLVGRIADVLDELHDHPAERIGIVSHGITGRAILTRLLALTPDRAGAARQPNDLVYRLARGLDGWSCSYFRGGAGPAQGLFSG